MDNNLVQYHLHPSYPWKVITQNFGIWALWPWPWRHDLGSRSCHTLGSWATIVWNIIHFCQHGNEEWWPGHGFWVCVHCDLELGDMTLGLGHVTPLGHGQQFCKILSRLVKGVRSYGPDTMWIEGQTGWFLYKPPPPPNLVCRGYKYCCLPYKQDKDRILCARLVLEPKDYLSEIIRQLECENYPVWLPIIMCCYYAPTVKWHRGVKCLLCPSFCPSLLMIVVWMDREYLRVLLTNLDGLFYFSYGSYGSRSTMKRGLYCMFYIELAKF